MNEQVRAALDWNGKGCPPPPPFPPCQYDLLGGIDFFGSAQRECDRLNRENAAAYERDRDLYEIVMALKRKPPTTTEGGK